MILINTAIQHIYKSSDGKGTERIGFTFTSQVTMNLVLGPAAVWHGSRPPNCFTGEAMLTLSFLADFLLGAFLIKLSFSSKSSSSLPSSGSASPIWPRMASPFRRRVSSKVPTFLFFIIILNFSCCGKKVSSFQLGQPWSQKSSHGLLGQSFALTLFSITQHHDEEANNHPDTSYKSSRIYSYIDIQKRQDTHEHWVGICESALEVQLDTPVNNFGSQVLTWRFVPLLQDCGVPQQLACVSEVKHQS